MKKRIISCCLVLMMVLLQVPQVFAKDIVEDFLSLSMSTEELGRIFPDFKLEKKFELAVKADDSGIFNGSFSYSITNDTGAVLYRSENIGFGLNDEKPEYVVQKSVPENITLNGVYYLNMVAYCTGSGEYSRLGEKKFEKTFYFSIAPEWKEGQERANIGINDCAKNYYNKYCEDLMAVESKLGMDSLRIGNEWQFVDRNGKWGFTKGFGEQLPLMDDLGYTDSIFMLGLNKYDYAGSVTAIPTDENNINAFLTYVEYVVKNTPHVKYYELWNEVEHGKWSDVTGPEDYAYLQKRVYEAIKAIRPDAMVGGMGSFATSYGEQSMSYWRRMLDAGIGEYTDFVVLHTYTYPKAPDTEGNAGAEVISNGGTWIKQLFKEYGIENIPVFLDECGVPTKESWRTGMGRIPDVYSTEDEQAMWLPRIAALAMSDGDFDRIWYYTYADDANEPFGIVRRSDEETQEKEFDNPMTAKKGYVTTCAWTRLMGNCEFWEGYTSPDEMLKLRGFARKSTGKKTIIGWHYNGTATQTFDLGCKSVEIYDQCANLLGKLESDSGIYNLTFNEEPIYIKGAFERIKTTDAKTAVELTNNDISATVGDKLILNFKANSNEKLDVNVEAGGNATVVQNQGIVNGKGSVELEIGDVQKDFLINISVVNSKGRVVYLNQKNVKINKEIISVEKITTENFSETDSYHWRSLVTLKNNTSGRLLCGNVRVTAPEDAAKISNTAKFINLKPQQSVTLRVNLPPMSMKESRTFEWTITLSDGQVFKHSEAIDLTVAKYTNKPPKIDGVLENGEWQSDWIREQSKEKVNILQSGAVWNGAGDLSMRCNMMYDAEKFYMAIRVSDDIHFASGQIVSNMWQLDSVQIGMEDVIGKVNANFLEFGLCSVDGKPAMYRWSSAYGGAMEYTGGYDLAVKRNGKYTDYELAVDWKTLFHEGFDINGVEELGFSMLVNDNDGAGREQFIEYNSGIGIVKNSLLFGRMKLVK